MSAENVEVVRCANEALNAHDIGRWVSLADPDFEFVDHMAAVGEEAGNLEALRLQGEGWIETFPDLRADVEEYIDVGERVVSVTHWHGTGSASGLDYSVHAAEITTVRNGKIVHLEMGFPDRAAALEAVGLRE